MITSDMGLLEIPHVPAPASVGDLHDAMRTQTFPEIAPFPIHFIPGVRNFAGPVDLDNFGMMDMMRGGRRPKPSACSRCLNRRPAPCLSCPVRTINSSP